jgi:hypothetical protein
MIPTIEAVRKAIAAARGVFGPQLVFGMVSVDGEDLEFEVVIAKRITSVLEVRSEFLRKWCEDRADNPPPGWAFYFKELRT